jgi:prepilin signal peptidase PulO-like enzyme (type II secretory pathway)
MSPETLFQIANPIALLGWLALIAAPLAPRVADWIAALIIPLLMSVAYSALVLAYWSGSTGGYGTLPEVMALFTNPHIALAGWVHYLAFDLFVGAWAVRTARAERIPHLLTLPHLALIFLFGPAGFLTFHAMRAALRLRTPINGASK